MGGPRLPPTLLRRVARVPLMLVMRAPAGSPARTRKLEISWWVAAKRARVPCGVGAGFWTARCSAGKFDDAASARGRDLMMRTAGARIMSISGARRAQTSPGMRAFGGPRWEGLLPGARTRAARTWRSPFLDFRLINTIWVVVKIRVPFWAP